MVRRWIRKWNCCGDEEIAEASFLSLMDEISLSWLRSLSSTNYDLLDYFQERAREGRKFLYSLARFGYANGITDGIYSRSQSLPR